MVSAMPSVLTPNTARVAGWLWALNIVGCAGQPVCDKDRPCSDGLGCVVGRCIEASAEAVPLESKRIVLSPTALAVVDQSGGSDSDAVVALGTARRGETRVLLQFEAGFGADIEIQRAFLVLHGEPSAVGPSSEVVLDAAPILSAWSPTSTSWGRQPSIGLPTTSLRLSRASRAPLRFDVTEAMRSVRNRQFGLAVVGTGSDPIGVRVELAAGAPRGPRLEVFFK